MSVFLPVIIVAVIGIIAGLGLALAAKFMSVPVDEKETEIRNCLPGPNCGACGFSGCDGYASALAKGEAPPDKCAPGGDDTASALSKILGVEVNAEPKIAFIACHGNCDTVNTKYEYTGLKTCAAANLLHSGPLECRFGCIGYGDCMRSCPFGAISMQNDRPLICEDICVGCGKCASVCPKSIISIIPKNSSTRVWCSNNDKGPQAVKVCKTSCIACGMCVKTCKHDAISIADNVAIIDYAKCTGCKECAAVCKRKAII